MTSLQCILPPLLLLPYFAVANFTPEKRGGFYSSRAEEAVIDDILDDIKYIYRWRQENFPDDQGRYANLDQPRWTVQDYYGPFDASNWQKTDFEETYPSFVVTDTGEELPFPYAVKEGDTLQSICEKFSTTPQKVLAVNPTLPSNPMLQPGDRILIPWE